MLTIQEYRAILDKGCPVCGESVQIKRGKYGEFVACSDWCGYKESILGRSDYTLPGIKLKICPFKQCDGSGLIPFKNKQGKIIPNTFEHCECYQPERDRYQALTPEDFDFPCSALFRERFSVY